MFLSNAGELEVPSKREADKTKSLQPVLDSTDWPRRGRGSDLLVFTGQKALVNGKGRRIHQKGWDTTRRATPWCLWAVGAGGRHVGRLLLGNNANRLPSNVLLPALSKTYGRLWSLPVLEVNWALVITSRLTDMYGSEEINEAFKVTEPGLES